MAAKSKSIAFRLSDEEALVGIRRAAKAARMSEGEFARAASIILSKNDFLELSRRMGRLEDKLEEFLRAIEVVEC